MSINALDTYIFEKLVKVECIECIDRIIESSMSRIDGSSEFIHAILDQMGTI